MVIIQSYTTAVVMCMVTMICWGSWANTMKLTRKGWPFQLYYWDYSLGLILFSLILAFTLGSTGTIGRSFVQDLEQANTKYLGYALLSGVLFNLANILLVVVIDMAGMAIAFPIGIGLALVIGVISGYIARPVGNAWLIFIGLIAVVIAIIMDGIAYGKIPSEEKKSATRGIVISILTGILMGFFYPVLVASMVTNLPGPEKGRLTPYSAIVIFSIGVFLSSFIWNYYFMRRPLNGSTVSFADYFNKGSAKDHSVGIFGGLIWCLGFSLMTLAGGKAGPAISYGLGQGATLVAAIWGVFVWKEFQKAPRSVNKLLVAMFIFYLLGLSLLIIAKLN